MAVGTTNSLLITLGGLGGTSLLFPSSFASSSSKEQTTEPQTSTGSQYAAQTANRKADQLEMDGPEISLGPLVSRGSAPLGPPLGTIQGSSTFSIDRNERAFDLAMEQLAGLSDSNLDVDLEGDPWNRSDLDPEAMVIPLASDEFGQPVILGGPDVFPSVVSGLGLIRSRTDMTAVLATLPEYRDVGSPVLIQSEIPTFVSLERSHSKQRQQAEEQPTDVLTAACNLLLGIGLATGPLYPDLIALVRNCLPRRNRARARCKHARPTWWSRLLGLSGWPSQS
jgi:hypothetical protein